MKLWVRSQDKENLAIIKSLCYANQGDKNLIFGGAETTFDICLGRYSTKERCLEIIDEIQELLTHNGMMLFKNVDVSEIPKQAFEPFKALAYMPNGDTKSEVTVHNAEVIVYEMPSE